MVVHANGGCMVGMDDEMRRLIDASCPDVRERTVHRINSGKKADIPSIQDLYTGVH